MRTDRFALVMIAACAVALCAPARSAKAEGSIMFGDQWWSQTAPEAKFQEFRDVPRGPFVPSLSLGQWDGRNTYVLSAVNAMQKDQAWHGMWAWGAKFNAKMGYISTPHRFAYNSVSPYTEVSPGLFLLPDSLQAITQRGSASGITNTLTDAVKNAGKAPLGFQTNVATARIRVRPQKGWTFDVSGRQTTRSGNKALGAFIGTSPGNPVVELWEPINQTMTDGGVRADYASDKVTVQANGNVSLFNNKVDHIRWDNTRRLTDSPTLGPAQGQLALAPDNSEVRGSVAVGVRLPRKTIFTGTAGMARISQSQDWLPVTTNVALRPDTIRVPGTNTQGKADVLNLDARLTTMAVDKLRGTVRFHSDKYDNKTPEWVFPHTVNGDVAVVGPFESTPFGNSNWVAGVDLDADATSRVSVGVTAELRTRERTHREVEKDKETVLGGRIRFRPMDGLSFDAKGRYGDRKLDAFNLDDYEGAEQPLLRRYDVASRKQTMGAGGVTWSPIEAFDVSANYSYLKNDYQDLSFGLTSDESNILSATGTIHATPRLDLRGGYGYSLNKTGQRSKQSLAGVLPVDAPSDSLAWTVGLKDKNVFVTAGFDWWVKPDKFSIVGDYEFSRDAADFDLGAGYGFYSTFLAAANRFGGDVPSTLYRRHDAVVEARYQLLKNTQLTARYAFEEFDAIDFATKDVPLVAASAAAIYLGDFYQDYRAHQVALMVRHTF